jgi:superfamily II DNA or RNA helicase
VFQVAEKPLVTAGGALYQVTEALKKRFTYAPIHKDQGLIENYRLHGKGHIWVPRGVVPVADEDRRAEGLAFEPPEFNFTPRSLDQSVALESAVHRVKAGRSFMIQAPTGWGKTYIGAALIGHAKVSSLIVVTKEDILEQWVQALTDVLGYSRTSIPIIQQDKYNISGVGKAPVALAMIQSIARWQRYPEWVYKYHGLLMIDECHRVAADMFANVMWQHHAKIRIGLSATPKRKDGRDVVLRQHIGQIEVKGEDYPMIPKVLVYNTGWTPPRGMPISPGRTGRVVKIMANDTMRNTFLMRLVATSFKTGRYTVIFSDQLGHLDNMAAILRQQGIASRDIGFYVGGLTSEERREVIRRRIVFATFKMASEATNVPRWDTAVLASPRSDVVQIVGRVLRTDPEKGEPVVFDIVDNHRLFQAFADKRRGWYLSIGATVKQKN